MSNLLKQMREKAYGLAYPVYEKHQIWVEDMANVTWLVHPETFADMLTTISTDLDGPAPIRAPGFVVSWLGIPLRGDISVPRGEVELRLAIRSGS